MLSNVLVVRPRLNQRRDDVTEFEEGRQYRYNIVSRCTGCVSGNGDISVLGLHGATDSFGFPPIQCTFVLTISKHYMSEPKTDTTGPRTDMETKTEMETKTGIDTVLVHWEEFALCVEEHFHAQEMFKRNPLSKPMGHR